MDLEEYNEMYEDAEVSTGGDFDAIPDGTYQVFVDGVELKETKEKLLPMLAWKLKIMNGLCGGRFLFKNSVITDKTIGFVKTDLSICKLKLKKFSALEKKLGELLNINLEVKVINKGEYQNIYFQRILSVEDGSMLAKDDTDPPF